MPCADYRAIKRTNRTEIAFFLPARGFRANLTSRRAKTSRSEAAGRNSSWFLGYTEAILNLGPLTSHAAYAANRISSNPKGNTKRFGWLEASATSQVWFTKNHGATRILRQSL